MMYKYVSVGFHKRTLFFSILAIVFLIGMQNVFAQTLTDLEQAQMKEVLRALPEKENELLMFIFII